MSARPPMRFFVDHCVPESVPRLLERKHYEVIRLREKTPADSSDHLVAAVAEANDAVLVTMDADFRQIASRTGIGRRRFKTLSLIRFEQCRESQAAGRLDTALSLIEHEWQVPARRRTGECSLSSRQRRSAPTDKSAPLAVVVDLVRGDRRDHRVDRKRRSVDFAASPPHIGFMIRILFAEAAAHVPA